MPIYKAEISAGSLLPVESGRIAALLLEQPDKKAWIQAIKVENLLQKPSPATATRMAKLIRNRLECIDYEGLQLIATETGESLTQLLLLAAVRHSRLLGDFMIDVYRNRLNRLETQLTIHDWDSFLHECEQRDPTVAEWSHTTRTKLLQVILRILAEAKYIDSTKSMRLTPPLLHPKVLRYISMHKDTYAKQALELR